MINLFKDKTFIEIEKKYNNKWIDAMRAIDIPRTRIALFEGNLLVALV